MRRAKWVIWDEEAQMGWSFDTLKEALANLSTNQYVYKFWSPK